MERNVVSLELAKKLKEAGWSESTPNHWAGEVLIRQVWPRLVANRFPAPTAQDLADLLPTWVEVTKSVNCYSARWDSAGAVRVYADGSGRVTEPPKDVIKQADTMADALALLYLKLQEQSQ